MSYATVERLGGLAALTGGVLVVITSLVGLIALDYENFDETARTGAYAIVSLLYLLAVILVLGGWSDSTPASCKRPESLGFLVSSWPSSVRR